jgi:hypothetical protein
METFLDTAVSGLESSCVFASDTFLSIFLYRVNQRTIRVARKSPDVNFFVADFDHA